MKIQYKRSIQMLVLKDFNSIRDYFQELKNMDAAFELDEKQIRSPIKMGKNSEDCRLRLTLSNDNTRKI